jgi:hypothetical protein
LDLQIKSYACLKFLGEVWVGDNEVELTKMPKNGRRRRKKEEAGRKKWDPRAVGR